MVPPSLAPFTLAGLDLALVDGRALFWPSEAALVVADLHLEKGSHFARRGQMLPPWDSRETLERLGRALTATGARRVYCLGDSFHDDAGPARLDDGAVQLLAELAGEAEFIWITGNHDAAMGNGASAIPGEICDELRLGGVILRHQAVPGETGIELSGHFHPRHVVSPRGRRIARPCAIASEKRLILPAFGAFTGGLDSRDPAIRAALQPARAIDAVVPAGAQAARFAVWRAAG